MTNGEALLHDARESLSQVLKPFQQQLNRRKRMAEFVQQCIRCLERDDFLQLEELLRDRMAGTVVQEEDMKDCEDVFDRLRAYAAEKVDRYRIEFIEDLVARAREANLPLEVDFPHFKVLKGIDGKVDFARRTTVINKKTLKSIDPRRIISAAMKVKRNLYDRPFEPQAFIDGMFRIYCDVAGKLGVGQGNPVPMQRFYLEYVLSMQSKPFFQDMDKGKFRGYSLDQLAVDIWRYYQAGTSGTSDGYALKLRSGRTGALWLLDSEGERRHINGISFQKEQ